MSLPTVTHYSQISHVVVFHFSHGILLLFHIPPYHPSNPLQPISIFLCLLHIKYIQITHVSLFLLVHTGIYHHYTSMSSCHSITGKHPPLTISLTPAPTFPTAKLSFLRNSFICTYSFSLCVSLKPFFHTCLPTSLILLQMCFFQNSPLTFIPNFTIPFKLTSLNQIRLTNSKSPNLLQICLHRDYHLDLHPNSIKHALPISDTRFSSNTTFNIHFTNAFASLSSKALHPVSPLISSFLTFPTSQSHRPIPFCRISKSSHSCWYHTSAPHPYISLFTTILFHPFQPSIYSLS